MPQIASKRYSSISIKEIRRTLFPKNQKNLFVFCLSHRNKITGIFQYCRNMRTALSG